jgi:hypothetical protein
MRILDGITDRKLDAVILYLTPREAKDLKSYVSTLLDRDPLGHFHVSSQDSRAEVTVCMYDPSAPPNPHFDERSKKLILFDQ